MIGHYFEAGYGTLGLVQAPTSGIILYEKLDDDIKTTQQFKTPDTVRKIKNRFVPPANPLEDRVNVSPKSDGLCRKDLDVKLKSVRPRNAKSKSEINLLLANGCLIEIY